MSFRKVPANENSEPYAESVRDAVEWVGIRHQPHGDTEADLFCWFCGRRWPCAYRVLVDFAHAHIDGTVCGG